MARTDLAVPVADLQKLVEWSHGSGRLAERARLILLSAQGLSERQVGAELGVVAPTVQKWKRRYSAQGLAGLADLPRPGQPKKLGPERCAELLRLTTEAIPPGRALQWSIRRLGQTAGVTEYQVRSVWSVAKIRPKHLKVQSLTEVLRVDDVDTDVVGLYVAPPFSAIAICVGSEPRRGERGESLAAPRRGSPAALIDRARTDGLYLAFERARSRTDNDRSARALGLIEILDRVDKDQARRDPVYVVFSCAAAMNDDRCAAALSERPRLFVHSFMVSATWVGAVETWFSAVEARRVDDELSASIAGLRCALARHNDRPQPSDFFWLKASACAPGEQE